MTAPTAPTSGRGDVLADGATALAAVQGDKGAFDTSAQSFVSGIQQDRLDLIADIGQSRTDAQADNVAATNAAQAEVNTDRQAAQDEFAADRDAAATACQAAVTEADAQQTALTATWTAVDTGNQQAYNGSLQNAQDAQGDAAEKQVEATANRQTLRDKALDDERKDKDWASRIPTVSGTFWAAINIPAHVQGAIAHAQAVHDDLQRKADEERVRGFARDYMVYGGVAADLVGLRAIVGAFDGADPYTLEQWSDGYRLFQGVTGVVTLVETAMGVSSHLS